jgi:hypothetical protein
VTPPSQALPAGRIDVPAAVRGASAGFSVLLIGGLLGPLIAVKAPGIGSLFLTGTAILAFFLAARKTGRATSPALHGAVAAVAAYLLVLPLVMMSPAGRNLGQSIVTLVTAVSVGALTGWMNSRPRS